VCINASRRPASGTRTTAAHGWRLTGQREPTTD
jgi:hypothetical protein